MAAWIVLIVKQSYKLIASLELAPWCVADSPYGPYGAIGTLVPHGYCTKYFNSNSNSRSMVFVPVLVPVLVIVPGLVLVRVRISANLKLVLWIFMFDMAIMMWIPKGRTRWCGNLKGLSHERGWVKTAKNLGASPFKRKPTIDTTFSQAHLARQSL
jgi:hypothetical protein